MPRFLAPLVLLFSLALPAAAAIVPGPEIEVTRPISEPPATMQSQARIASAWDGFLAVWVESGSTFPSIHAARIAADGTPIDTTPLVVSDSPADNRQPDVVWAGQRYFVVWAAPPIGLFGRFVERDGSMSETIQIATGSVDSPRVAWNSKNLLVMWSASGSTCLVGAQLDANGSVLQRLEFPNAGCGENTAAIAPNGDFFAVSSLLDYKAPSTALGPPGDVGTIHLGNSTGTISRMPREVIEPPTAYVSDLRAASNGGGAVIAWTSTNGDVRQIKYVGMVVLGAGAVLSFDAGTSRVDAVVQDSAGYLVVYGDDDERFVRRGGASTSQRIASLPQSRVVAAATGASGTVLIVSSGFNNLYLQRIDDDEFVPLTLAARHQSGPHIAGSGSIRLAAWSESTGMAVVASRIGPKDQPLDPNGIVLGGSGTSVRVAEGAQEWLVVWKNNAVIEGVRVGFDGSVLDAAPITIAREVHYGDVNVAWDGALYVVVFARGTPTRIGGSFQIFGARVTGGGIVESSESLFGDYGPNWGPAIAAGRDGSLVVWSDTNSKNLQAALLSRAGTVTPLGTLPGSERTQPHVTVAWNGGKYLVASPSLDNRIRFFLVSETGVVTPAPETASIPFPAPYWTTIEASAIGDRFVLTYAISGVLYAATIEPGSGYVADAPAAVAQIGKFEARFGLSGGTLVYAHGTDPLRERLSRVFVKTLAAVPNPPRRRSVR